MWGASLAGSTFCSGLSIYRSMVAFSLRLDEPCKMPCYWPFETCLSKKYAQKSEVKDAVVPHVTMIHVVGEYLYEFGFDYSH